MSYRWQSRACLVTGGAGFGGGHLCAELLGRGACVHVYDRLLARDSFLALSGLTDRVEMIPGDVRDRGFLQLTLERFEIDTVFHLAAQPLVPVSNALPWETFEANVLGTYAVLEAVRQSSRKPSLVVASSGAYYGTTTTDEPITEEQAPLLFTNLYAATKAGADIAVRAYAQVYGLRAALCRFMNTYGPGDTNFSRLVPRAIRNLIRGDDYGFGDRDGTTRLDFLHVRDMAAAYLAVAEKLETVAGEAFNVGSGRPVCVRDVAALVSEVYDGRRRQPIFRGPHKEMPVVKSLDTAKAKRLLGWSPQIPLEEGLRETVAWYRDHWTALERP